MRRVSRDSQKNNLPIAGISISGFFFYLKAAEAAAAELVDDCQVFNLRSLIHHGGIFFTLLVSFLKYIFRQAGRRLLPRDSSSFFAFPIHSLVLYADR